MSNQSGLSLLELVIVLIVSIVIVISVAINIGPRFVSFDIDDVAVLTSLSVNEARRSALSGKNTQARTFDLATVLASRHPGIVISTTAPVSTSANGCTQTSTQNCPSSLCVSGQVFCYDAQAKFEFEKYSGRVKKANNQITSAPGHAVFVISQYRKLAVLISPDGQTDIAELINGQWRARTDLQHLAVKP